MGPLPLLCLLVLHLSAWAVIGQPCSKRAVVLHLEGLQWSCIWTASLHLEGLSDTLQILSDTLLVEGILRQESLEIDIMCVCTRMGPSPPLCFLVLHLSASLGDDGQPCSKRAVVLHLEGLVDWPVLWSLFIVARRKGPGDSSSCTRRQ